MAVLLGTNHLQSSTSAESNCQHGASQIYSGTLLTAKHRFGPPLIPSSPHTDSLSFVVSCRGASVRRWSAGGRCVGGKLEEDEGRQAGRPRVAR